MRRFNVGLRLHCRSIDLCLLGMMENVCKWIKGHVLLSVNEDGNAIKSIVRSVSELAMNEIIYMHVCCDCKVKTQCERRNKERKKEKNNKFFSLLLLHQIDSEIMPMYHKIVILLAETNQYLKHQPNQYQLNSTPT
jgi:hypothetical protein